MQTMPQWKRADNAGSRMSRADNTYRVHDHDDLILAGGQVEQPGLSRDKEKKVQFYLYFYDHNQPGILLFL